MKKLLDRLTGSRRENPETPDSGYFSTMFLEREEETPTLVPWAVRAGQLQAKLEKSLGPALTAYDYSGYFVVDKKKRIVASSNPELIGKQNVPEYDSFVTRALDSETCVSAPFGSVAVIRDETG